MNERSTQDQRAEGRNISLPADVWVEIDEMATKGWTSRSRVILRIITEWKEAKETPVTTEATVSEAA
jgi:metal-responsive CopG/Arc/MetJ family transcriptional regulator